MKKIQGVYAAMITPLNEHSQLDIDNIERLVELLIIKGVDGIFPVSSVGESASLSYEESVQLMQITINKAQGRVKIIPGATSTNVNQTRKLMIAAHSLGCDTVVVAPPFYYNNSQEGLIAYYQAISEDIDIRIIAYNIPLFTTAISYPCFEGLLKNPSIIGIKDSSGNALDFMNYRHLIKQSQRDDVSLLIGREEFFLGGLMLGADGCMVGTASIVPEALVAIKHHFEKNEITEAMAIQEKLVPLVQELFKIPFPAGFKIGLAARDISIGKLNKPFSPAELAQCEVVKEEINYMIKGLIS
ncbi:2-keto-3-deoxy gluconate aldolase [Gammaproteobacteria bacterium]|nr:2-keto-3-deoxy gluconate aldolase [Gammaproteobacteria bacterium]